MMDSGQSTKHWYRGFRVEGDSRCQISLLGFRESSDENLGIWSTALAKEIVGIVSWNKMEEICI
jgi:hypothetical protein